MGWFSSKSEVPDSVKQQEEMARKATAERKAARDNEAKSDRLTRDALRTQVWFNR
jgi:hypothetical protein